MRVSNKENSGIQNDHIVKKNQEGKYAVLEKIGAEMKGNIFCGKPYYLKIKKDGVNANE